MSSATVIIAFGANTSGKWGEPIVTMKTAMHALSCHGTKAIECSEIYVTAPLSSTSQPDYLNAVVRATTRQSASALLRLAKRLERRAGRRPGPVGAARPLDIDIIDFSGQIRPARYGRTRGRLTLPHPEMHRRAFVLIPMHDVAPRWRHPMLRWSMAVMLRRVCGQMAGVKRWTASMNGEGLAIGLHIRRRHARELL